MESWDRNKPFYPHFLVNAFGIIDDFYKSSFQVFPMLIYSTPCHGSLTMLLSIDYIYIYIYSCIDSLLDVVTSIKNLKRKRKSRHSPSCIRGVFNFLDVQLTENNNTSSKTKNWWWWFWNDLPNFFCILDAFSSSFSAFDWIIENRWWLI